eukprot:UN07045
MTGGAVPMAAAPGQESDYIKSMVGGDLPTNFDTTEARQLLHRASVMISIQNLQPRDTEARLKGKLLVKSASGFRLQKKWRERYCKLNEDSLLIYKSSKNNIPKDSISIHMMTAVTEVKEKSYFRFDITSRMNIPMSFRTRDKPQGRQWFTEINKLIKMGESMSHLTNAF